MLLNIFCTFHLISDGIWTHPHTNSRTREHLQTHARAFRELSASRQKHEAISARCKTLEVDYRTMRAKMGAVLDKSDADDRLIDALKTELEVGVRRTLGHCENAFVCQAQ